MFEAELRKFCVDNELGDEVVEDLLNLFNTALLEVGRGILDSVKIKTVEKKVVKKSSSIEQRWASKVSANYAMENNLTLDNFEGIEKVTKQHILDYLKENATIKTKSPKTSTPKTTEKQIKGESSTTSKKKVQCNGFNPKGACTRTGTVIPDGAKNSYCFRCADTWTDFETTVSSDSDSDSESEQEQEKPATPQKKITSEDDLSEEPILD